MKTKILDYYEIRNGWNGNTAISSLTEGVVEDIFINDGRPNLKVVYTILYLFIVLFYVNYCKKLSLRNACTTLAGLYSYYVSRCIDSRRNFASYCTASCLCRCVNLQKLAC